jgi:hypothetical protein
VRWLLIVIARVVTKRDDARLASFVTAAAALFLLLVLADDAFHLTIVRAPASAMFLTVAVAMAVAGVGPWLAWPRRRGRTVQLQCANGRLEARRLRIAAGDVRAVSVALAAQGASVAIEHGPCVTFFEVERAEDAARIAATLSAAPTPASEVVVVSTSRRVSLVQAMVSLVTLVSAPLYYLGATRVDLADGAVADPKALFGLLGVVAAGLSFLFLVARQWWPNQGGALGSSSAWEAHAAIHRERAEQAGHGDAEPPTTNVEHVRIGVLGRGDEGVGAWLARLDAIPTEHHAYRGDALEKDVLWDALGDAAATVDARMAAARVLRRRYGEEEGALVRVVDDPEVRQRVEAALHEHDDAESRIETLGPLFRARRLI